MKCFGSIFSALVFVGAFSPLGADEKVDSAVFDTVPILKKMAPPTYPPEAKERHIEGRVRLSVLVDEKGRVEDVKVNKGHKLLAEAAIDAVYKAHFEPATLDGDPISLWGPIPIDFSLDDSGLKGKAPQMEEYVEFDEAPSLTEMPRPLYPPEARQQRVDGTVLVRVLVGIDGLVKEAFVLSGPMPLLEAALDAAKLAVFKPAIKDDEVKAVWMVIPMEFSLK